jgi:hypothetical protein
VLFKKTSQAMMTTYMAIILLFTAPLAVQYFADTFFPYDEERPEENRSTLMIRNAGFTSPFAAAQAVPLDAQPLTPSGSPNSVNEAQRAAIGNWPLYFGYVGFSLALDGLLLVTMIWLFNTRWRVAA